MRHTFKYFSIWIKFSLPTYWRAPLLPPQCSMETVIFQAFTYIPVLLRLLLNCLSLNQCHILVLITKTSQSALTFISMKCHLCSLQNFSRLFFNLHIPKYFRINLLSSIISDEGIFIRNLYHCIYRLILKELSISRMHGPTIHKHKDGSPFIYFLFKVF